MPIIDTHIHLFDPTRPGGVPWPPKTNTLVYKPALPPRFSQLAAPHNVVGAIEVECSPLLEDNQWVLDVAAKHPIIVGMIGNLEPSKPDFRRNFDRFHKNPLFLGIRYGYLWDRNLRDEIAKPEFIAGLKVMASANLTLDTANPSQQVLDDILRLHDKVPNLRIVIDHLAGMPLPKNATETAAYKKSFQEIAQRKTVYVKGSSVLRIRDPKKPADLSMCHARLEELWATFGPDRLFYGSDWPNSEPLGPYADIFKVVHDFFQAKGPQAAEKYFWRNSIPAYRWIHRAPTQPKA